MEIKTIHDVADFLTNRKDLSWRDWQDGGIQYWYAESELYVIRKMKNGEA